MRWYAVLESREGESSTHGRANTGVLVVLFRGATPTNRDSGTKFSTSTPGTGMERQ